MNAMFSDTSHACFSFDKCRVYTKPCDQQRVLFTACQVPRTLFMWLHMIYLKHVIKQILHRKNVCSAHISRLLVRKNVNQCIYFDTLS